VTAEPSRRHVLCGLAVALLAPGAVIAACSTDDSADPAPPHSVPVPTSNAPDEPPGAIVTVDSVPVGGGVIALAFGRPVLLVQPKKGTIEAFDPICPHQGFTVDPPVNGTIVCPGHGSRFDGTTGARKSGPAPRGLTRVSVKVSQGYVVQA